MGVASRRPMAAKSKEWQRKAEVRSMRIEKCLAGFAGRHKRIEIILLKLPQLLKKKIGFQRQK
jgi:hypothetical protein